MASELEMRGLMDMLSKFGMKEGAGKEPYSTSVMDNFIKKLNIGDEAEIDNPAEREFLDKVMKTNYKNATRDYDFEVDGKTEGYTFSGDAPLSGQAIQNMRDMQGITADGQMLQKATNLGLGAEAGASVGAMPEFMPGKTPTIPNVVPPGFHRMPDGTVMADGSMNYAGTGEMSPQPQTVDRTKFNSQFANLSSQEQDQVKQMMANMNANEKSIFASGLIGAPLGGFAVQNQSGY